MTAIELFHVGVLVGDLEGAISRFSARLGLTFETPRAIDVVVEEGGSGRPRTVRVAYSIEGPPFVELIESQPDGLWGRHHGEGLHHVGGWDGEFGVGGIAPGEAGSSRPDSPHGARIFRDGELAAVYLPSADLHGVRVELVVRPTGDPAP